MSKIIRIPVYEERIVCEYCGFSMEVEKDGFRNYQNFDVKCDACNKVGCLRCITWFSINGKKYTFHESCRKDLPKDVLEKRKAIEEEWEREERYHKQRFPPGQDHII